MQDIATLRTERGLALTRLQQELATQEELEKRYGSASLERQKQREDLKKAQLAYDQASYQFPEGRLPTMWRQP